MASQFCLCVVICTYNGARYLLEQLESISFQTRLPDNVVILDDCSNDNTLDIVNTWSKLASFPVVIMANHNNIGCVKNFEKAIGLCAGDIIVLADQDDVWLSGKLARIEEEFIKRPNVDAVFSDADLIDVYGNRFPYSLWDAIDFSTKEQHSFEQGNAFDVLLRRNVVTGATMAFRGRLKPHLLPIPNIWIHDEWLAIVISAIGKIRMIPERLVQYRQHGANLIGAKKLTFADKVRMLMVPRAGFYEKLFLKTVLLRERLISLAETPPYIIAELSRKMEHMKFRSGLPKARARRLLPVAHEWWSGNYDRYSTGWKSIVRDVFEPL